MAFDKTINVLGLKYAFILGQRSSKLKLFSLNFQANLTLLAAFEKQITKNYPEKNGVRLRHEVVLQSSLC